jgi:hypothetical protein
VLKSAIATLRAFIASDAHQLGDELPGKTFTATPGWESFQCDGGALTHEFEIGGIRSRRMVVPYQMWMLQRIAGVLEACTETAEDRSAIEGFLSRFPAGHELLELDERLAGCRVRKEGGRLFSRPDSGE